MAFPQEGTGPGQQLGDLVYNFAMARVAKEAQDALVDLGIELRIPVSEALSISTYLDQDTQHAHTDHSMEMAFFRRCD
eukprot:1907576-Pyramimonas_sp.AAC.1